MHSVHYSQKAEEGGKNDDVFSLKAKLILRASEGDEQALAELISAYSATIRNVAFHYKHDSVTLDELIHEGEVAIWQRVIFKFDLDKAGNIDAYVNRCVHSAIFAYANNMRQRPLSRSLITERNYLLKEMRRYELELGRAMTEEEMIEYMNQDSDKKYDIESIKHILTYGLPNTHTSSLSEPCFDDGSETKEDRLVCPNLLPDEHLESRERKKLVVKRVDEVLSSMNERDKSMIKIRIGLCKNHRGMTLRALGRFHNLSFERIRQIEKKGLERIIAKLRHDPILQEVI